MKHANGKKIDQATNESEYWKVIKDISKAKTKTRWKLNDGVNSTESEGEIASRFNNFLPLKLKTLKPI